MAIMLAVQGNFSQLKYLWAFYVRGFRAEHHCQKCLRGTRSKQIRLGMGTDPVTMDEYRQQYDYLYVCAGSRKGYAENVHMVLKSSPGQVAQEISPDIEIVATGASRVAIPPLPRGFQGLPERFTTCRNFQFGVEYYGV